MRLRCSTARRAVLGVLLCLAGAVTVVNACGWAEFRDDGASFRAQIKLFARGETRLSLPPLGTASAYTHHAPVRIQLELRGLNPSFLRNLGGDTGAKEFMVAETRERAQRAVSRVAYLAVGLAGLGSLLTVLLLGRSPASLLAGAFLLGCLFCGGLLAWAYLDYDVAALAQPRYEGMLESASWVMSVLTDSEEGLEGLGRGLAAMARNLPRLAARTRAGTPMSDVDEDLRVLHVSDIHNNRAALKLIEALVASFAIDLVVDTGDLTDFGTALETDLTAGIAGLKVPYVFVPGNHDAPEVVSRLRRARNVVILDGRVVRVKGLRILGLPDPSSQWQSPAVAEEDVQQQAGEQLAHAWSTSTVKPDLVAAHSRGMLAPLIGRAPVVLHGHDHSASIRMIGGTLVEDAGTTGAAGFRGLASTEDIPYTVALQYWRRVTHDRLVLVLVAVDAIAVSGLHGTLHIERTVPRLLSADGAHGP